MKWKIPKMKPRFEYTHPDIIIEYKYLEDGRFVGLKLHSREQRYLDKMECERKKIHVKPKSIPKDIDEKVDKLIDDMKRK